MRSGANDPDDVGLPLLREILPPGRENAQAVIDRLRGAVERNAWEFPDGGKAGLEATEWLRKLLNAEYDAAEDIPDASAPHA